MARAASLPVPRAKTKTAADENFPVASLLLAADKRARVMAFYRFARAADDVADDAALDPADKLDRLDLFERGLSGQGGHAAAQALHAALDGDCGLLAHAAALLQAFRRDAMGDCCHSWADLMAYCACSAAPVGRFLLDLHGQDRALHRPADCLCAALQVLNHIQDCGDDYRRLGRVYLPADWLDAAGLAPARLADGQGGTALRHVLDLMLDRVDMLLEQAAALPDVLTDRRLAMQAAATWEIARRLAAVLRRRDPLAATVRLSPAAYVAALIQGAARGMRPRP